MHYAWYLASLTTLAVGTLALSDSATQPAASAPASAPATQADAPSFVARLKAGQKQHIVTYGTSLTEGGAWVGHLRATLNKQFPGLATVTNSGVGAQWSTWGVENLKPRVLDKHPDAVIIEFGINDAFLEYKTSLEQTRKNLESMIDQILAQNPHCQIILQTMNPPVREHLERRPNVEQYYQLYRDIAKERHLLLVDHYPVWKKLLDTDPKKFDEYVPDGIHPSVTGYEKITTPTLLKALGL